MNQFVVVTSHADNLGFTPLTESNRYGELGLGGKYSSGTRHSSSPLHEMQVHKVAGSLLARKVVSLAAGPTHAMAIDESSALYSWGRTFEGQAAQPSNMGVVLAPRLVRFTSENPVVAVA
jgi:alpha-tubulin suppressor-like RCC1 family protein